MRFEHIDFNKNFFILDVEDGTRLCFPYGKVDYLTTNPIEKKLILELKKQGTFMRFYKDYSQLESDMEKIMARGK